jgi:hypothetical protein
MKKRKKTSKPFIKKNWKYLLVAVCVIFSFIVFYLIPWHQNRIETSNQLKEEVRDFIEWQEISVLTYESSLEGTQYQIVANQENWEPDCYIFCNVINEHGVEKTAYIDMNSIDVCVYAELNDGTTLIFKVVIS